MFAAQRKRLVALALVVTVVGLALGLVADAQAQQLIYYSGSPVVYEGSVQYQRVYQGSSWYWSPQLGWHTHAHYVNVPYWSPSYYVSSPPMYVPVVTHYYSW